MTNLGAYLILNRHTIHYSDLKHARALLSGFYKRSKRLSGERVTHQSLEMAEISSHYNINPIWRLPK